MFCKYCGKEVPDNAAFCTECGKPLGDTATKPTTPIVNACNLEIAPRSIVTAILLSIVTCGIYGIYWFVVLTNDMNKLAGKEQDTNGGMALLLTLLTCGIYSIIWSYKMGEKRDIVAGENASSNIIYLILSLVGFGIVVYILAQDAINKAVERQ